MSTVRRSILLLLLLFLVPIASAHASLASAVPAPNGHADIGITVVQLNFTETVEKKYTSVDVVGLDQQSWATGPPMFDDAHPNIVRLPVRPLEDGVYAVNWKALSVDSHTTQGSYLFSVGSATLAFTPPVTGHAHEDDAAQVLREGAARWVFYACLFASVGAPFFVLVVQRDEKPALSPVVLVLSAAIVGCAAAYLGLWFLAQRTGLGFADAAQTDAGLSFDWRGTLLGAAAVAFAVALLPAVRRVGLAAGAVLAVGALVWVSLGSHAASDADLRALGLAIDITHLLMGSLWIGGVAAFLLAARGRTPQQVGALIARFTPLAIASVAIILATGTYASVRRIPSVSDLWGTSYGRLVSAKVLLLAPLVALGAYNKQVAGPALLSGRGSPRAFRRALAVEALVMALVLAAAGVLASSSPPETAVKEGTQEAPDYAEFTQASQSTHVVLLITPNPVVVGIQNLTIELHWLTSQPVGKSASIQLKIAPPGAPEPDQFVDPGPTRLTDDTWALQGGVFTSPGNWQAWVLVQRPEVGEFTKLHFVVPVKAPG